MNFDFFTLKYIRENDLILNFIYKKQLINIKIYNKFLNNLVSLKPYLVEENILVA